MPQKKQQVKFSFGTQAEYNALPIKDQNTFYIITDTQKIYIGNKMYTSKITIENLEDTFLSAFEVDSLETGTVPIINNDGQLVSSGFSLGKNVPSDAIFTDNNTTYTLTQDANDGHIIIFTPSSGQPTTITIPDNNTTNNATTSISGLMSSIDKTKLDGIATGAQVNQNAFSNIIIGATTIAADSKTDTLTLIAGNNVTLTPDNSNGTVTITAIDTINSGTVTNISTGIGLDGGPITSTGTVKVKLKSETTLSEQAVINETANKTYAVRTDSDGYLAVNIPWTDTTYNTATASTNGVGGSNGLMSATDKEKLNTLPNIVSLTQAQYELLNPPDASTLYIIIEGGENE